MNFIKQNKNCFVSSWKMIIFNGFSLEFYFRSSYSRSEELNTPTIGTLGSSDC